ncbi:hypothetical protein KAFR_0B05130 [Kazachstania africana CBS 2517]|uniref:GATA-type domain-containing protein n=1 Tax=Kazachstania africana (strain ATCC 22294 / BCRC 22015 / CBS 2517 / CECT 1963 / NBRC 1671 / NRRL Y-8276) TaxID=1071382 RepID=H2AR09_KAZAF|nr:hypothetical protein KAFR_0B05130 [Kazachstania africana CBS 2517]CCF56809.1 hypothetical protein KAFR_0B05130 [Kazachstania africana CBS 2517]
MKFYAYQPQVAPAPNTTTTQEEQQQNTTKNNTNTTAFINPNKPRLPSIHSMLNPSFGNESDHTNNINPTNDPIYNTPNSTFNTGTFLPASASLSSALSSSSSSSSSSASSASYNSSTWSSGCNYYATPNRNSDQSSDLTIQQNTSGNNDVLNLIQRYNSLIHELNYIKSNDYVTTPSSLNDMYIHAQRLHQQIQSTIELNNNNSNASSNIGHEGQTNNSTVNAITSSYPYSTVDTTNNKLQQTPPHLIQRMNDDSKHFLPHCLIPTTHNNANYHYYYSPTSPTNTAQSHFFNLPPPPPPPPQHHHIPQQYLPNVHSLPCQPLDQPQAKQLTPTVSHQNNNNNIIVQALNDTFKTRRIYTRKGRKFKQIKSNSNDLTSTANSLAEKLSSQQSNLNTRYNNDKTKCLHCDEIDTPEWRRGPYGNRTLCNACGLFYRKLVKKFGNKNANLLMRFNKLINPEDRRIPLEFFVPGEVVKSLDSDPTLDSDYFTKIESP